MRDYRRWWTICGGVLGVSLLLVAAYNYCRCYCSPPTRLTLSGGNVCPLRSELAGRMAASISGNVEISVCRQSNSEAICQAVDSGELDLGLILGGLPARQYPAVKQVASLGVEPLHLLVRRELLAAVSEPTLEMLRHRRVTLGERGSNGARLAEDLLQLASLEPSEAGAAGDFQADHSPEDALIEQVHAWRIATGEERQALEARLPDAVFIVDALPSDLVDDLVQEGDYGLVPLPFAKALHLDSRRDHAAGQQLQNDRVESTSIPAFAYGIQPATPARDCETVGLRLLLVANKNVSSDALRDALRAMSDAAATHAQIHLDVSNSHPEFPVHPGAEAFVRARQPLNLGEILGPTTDALSVFGATIAGCLATWGFVRGLRAIHPDVHLKQIDRIERLLHGSEQDDSAPTLPREFVEFLETRLAQVKQAAIEDYASGRLNGDEALVGILTLIADTRHLLAHRKKQLALQHGETRLPVRGHQAA